MSDYINEILSVIVTAVIIPLVTYLGKVAIDFLQAKVDELKIKKAVEATRAAVAEINQEYVDELKAVGNFNAEEKAVAFNKAFELSAQLIDAKTQALIDSTFNNFGSWLQAQIEAAVRKK